MGCDIHIRVYDKEHQEIPAPDLGPYYEGGPSRRRWYDDRSYVLFAFLANVRNGFGFAGVETHQPLTPISKPRGLPSWLPADYDEGEERDGLGLWLGDHSFTWLGREEILGADWEQEVAWPGGPEKMADMAADFRKMVEGLPQGSVLVMGFDS